MSIYNNSNNGSGLNDNHIQWLFDHDLESFPIDSIKESIKRSLFKKLKYEDCFEEIMLTKVKNIAENTVPALGVKNRIKMNLMERVNEKPVPVKIFDFFTSQFSDAYSFSKATVVAVLMFAFVFNNSNIPGSQAFDPVVLDEVQGQVLVIRDGKIMYAKKDMVLIEGDFLITDENSKAELKFFNNSVAKLDNGTRTEIRTVVHDHHDVGNSMVNMNIVEGRVWHEVKKDSKESPEIVFNTEKTLTKGEDGAIYNIEVASKGETNVTAIKKNVDVQVISDDKNVLTRELKEGKEIVLEAENTEKEITVVVVDKTKNKKWMEHNIIVNDIEDKEIKTSSEFLGNIKVLTDVDVLGEDLLDSVLGDNEDLFEIENIVDGDESGDMMVDGVVELGTINLEEQGIIKVIEVPADLDIQ